MKSFSVFFIALVSMLLAEGAFAASCKYRQETNDFFSGVATLRTVWAPVNPGNCEGDCNSRGSLSIVREPGKLWIEFDASFTNSFVFAPTQDQLDDSFNAPMGTKLEISLVDGSLVELLIDEPVIGTNRITYPYENGNNNYIVRSSARLHFTLNEASLIALAAQRATLVRLIGEKGKLIMPVPKRTQTFMEAANCLQKAGS